MPDLGFKFWCKDSLPTFQHGYITLRHPYPASQLCLTPTFGCSCFFYLIACEFTFGSFFQAGLNLFEFSFACQELRDRCWRMDGNFGCQQRVKVSWFFSRIATWSQPFWVGLLVKFDLKRSLEFQQHFQGVIPAIHQRVSFSTIRPGYIDYCLG